MPSQFKQDNPGCDCCGDVCSSCDAITYLTISGLATTVSCPSSACEDKNGTYVFRSVGDPIVTCSWSGTWPGDNCGYGSPLPFVLYYIGYQCAGAAAWGVVFTNVSGGIQVDVTIAIAYERDEIGVKYRASYIARFRKTVATCAEIAGDVPFLSISGSTGPCSGSNGDTGDLCGMSSATVTLG